VELINTLHTSEFGYLLVAAVIFSFYASFMGGANDFANSFGTSVGSGAIKLKFAVLIAIVATFTGAVFAGGNVTSTIRQGIVDPLMFEGNYRLLALGLISALVGSGAFIQVASRYGLPVSTTHAIVGALVGFGVVSNGFWSISWGTVGWISVSWVLSPIGGALFGYFVFKVISKQVLQRDNPAESARFWIPFFIGLAVTSVTLSMIYKGLKNLNLALPLWQAIPIALLFGLLIALVAYWRIGDFSHLPYEEQLEMAERKFRFIQIFTAGYMAFAHGSNDVANGVGPLAGVYALYMNGFIPIKAAVPVWILTLGGVGIVLGLAVFGKKVIETIGTKITHITPSRGFAAEFAAATIVLIFSKAGMPISTTHTIVGAVIGVGMARGMASLDMRVIRHILTSWVVTIPAAAVASALTFWLAKMILGW